MCESKRYILWGSAGHAKVLDAAIHSCGGSVVALFDNDPDAKSVLQGIPLIGGVDSLTGWAERTPNRQEMFGLVAIGGARGRERLGLQQLLVQHGLRMEPLVHPLAFAADGVELGPGTQVLAMALVAVDARFGAACIVNHKASIDHECQIADGVHIAPGATLCGCVIVEKHAMIGAGAVVLPRVHIGRDSIVGAGAVVTRDVPDGVIVAGNPATFHRRVAPDHRA